MMVSKFQVSFFSGTMLVFRGLLKLLYSSPMSFLASYKKNFSWRFLQGYGSGMRMGVPFPLGVCGISIDLPSTKLTYPLQCWSAPQRPPRRRFKKPIFATQKLKVSWLDDRIPSPKYAPLFCGGVGFGEIRGKSTSEELHTNHAWKMGWRFSGVLFFGGKFWPCFRGRDVRFYRCVSPSIHYLDGETSTNDLDTFPSWNLKIKSFLAMISMICYFLKKVEKNKTPTTRWAHASCRYGYNPTFRGHLLHLDLGSKPTL